MHQSHASYINVLTHTLCYVTYYVGYDTLLKADTKIKLQVFTDFDWDSNLDSRKFVTCYVLLLGQSSVT